MNLNIGNTSTGGNNLEINPSKLALYRLMIEEMKVDGLIDEARLVQQKLNLAQRGDEEGNQNTSHSLFAIYENHANLVNKPLETEGLRKQWQVLKCRPYPPVAPQEDLLDLRILPEEDDMFIDEPSQDISGGSGSYLDNFMLPPAPQIKLRFNSQHKQGCRSVAFSHDGRLCASGSVDTSIKVMETSKMRMHSVVSSEGGLRPLGAGATGDEMRPVIRTFYDHVATVSCVTFHPRVPVLYSGSIDKTVKVYDLTRPTQNKKAQSSVTDVSPINVITAHPCGDYLFVGTQHRVVRLYDTTTMQCYSSYHSNSQHSGSVLDIKSSADGSMFASTSSDGSVFLWDGINHRVVNRINHAHAGYGVFTCQWSRNQRYLLTSGGDHRARLWDLRTGKMLQVYAPASTATHCDFMTAVFAGQEKYILLGSSEMQDGGDLSLLDSKSGSVLVRKVNAHERPIRSISANPSDKTFLTGSEDGRVRFFDIDTSGIVQDTGDQSVDNMQYSGASGAAGGGFLQHIGL